MTFGAAVPPGPLAGPGPSPGRRAGWVGGLLLSVSALAALVAWWRWGGAGTPPPPPASVSGVAPTGPRAAPPRAFPRFTDIAASAGLTVPHFDGAEGEFRLVETMGGGVGLIDFDGDGWLDVYLAQGCTLPHDPSRPHPPCSLYRNNRDATFTDVTEAAGVGFQGYAQGVAVGDYDGDGRDDLYVSALGPGALYRNRGDGTFEDVTDLAGVAGTGWGTSCAFADLDADGDLDLYVVHYLAGTVDAQGHPTVRCNGTPGRLGYCPPSAFRPEPDRLYRNNGDGTFTDVSAGTGIAAEAGNGLGLAIVDLDDDGRLDIFVANDQTPNLLFHNLGGLRFEEVALGWGLAYNEDGQTRAGMGVAVGDYDGDGRDDLYVTNFYEEGSTLYRNVAPGQFQVTTATARLAVPTRGVLGFGTVFLDADLDGRLDLFQANGHVNDVRPVGMPYAMPPQVFRNDGGRFSEASGSAGPSFREARLGRGVASGDLDNDGDSDLIVTHLGRPPALLRNDTDPRGHFLSLRLIGGEGRRSPVGARVIATVGGRTIARTVAAGTSYLSAGDRRVLLGLGDATTVDRLEVLWPSGAVQTWEGLASDRSYAIMEGGAPEPVEPSR